MRQAIGGLLVLILLAGPLTTPVASAQDERCIGPPELAPDYEWEYIDQDGVHRFEEVVRTGPTISRYGQWNMTSYGFMEIQDGQTLRSGRFSTFNDDGPYPMGLTQVDTRTQTEGEDQRTVEVWEPPLRIVHDGQRTCVPDAWTHETTHVIARPGDPPAGGQRNETWQARALEWTNVTVPAGTFEALHVRAVREEDLYSVDTWWSPEARHAVKIQRGPHAEAPVETLELAWYILDQRPVARFQMTPDHPEAGDTLRLDAGPSYDRDGNVTSYRWEITTMDGAFERQGQRTSIPDVPAGTLSIRLYVTDDADRISRRSATFHIPMPGETAIGVDGPLAAEPGQIVRLEAATPFDPLRVQWRAGDRIVGDGPVYTFRMEDNRTLNVSALHVSGRTYTTEHTVTRVPPGTLTGDATDGRHTNASAGSARGALEAWPTGGSRVLALLDPLEGQVVDQSFQAEIWTSGPATLDVDGQEVWSGQGPQATVDLDLEPGRHTLVLSSDQGRHEVNVTARGPGMERLPDRPGDAAGSDRVPMAGPVVTLLALAGVALAHAVRRQGPGRDRS